MVKRGLKNLINLGSFANYKKLPTYKKSKQKNKENVSNNEHRGMQANSTYLESVPLESMKKLVNQFRTPFSLLTTIY